MKPVSPRRLRPVIARMGIAALAVAGVAMSSGSPLLVAATPSASPSAQAQTVRQQLKMTAKGSAAGSITSSDGLVTIVLPAGAVAPAKGVTAVQIAIQQLDPGALPPPPAKLFIRGSAYGVGVTQLPSKKVVTTLKTAGSITVTYPNPTGDFARGTASILFSPDNKAWRAIQATDSRTTKKLTGSIIDMGLFAAAFTKPPKPKGKPFPWWIVIVVVVGGGVVFLIGRSVRERRAEARRREQRRQQHVAQSRSTKKRRR